MTKTALVTGASAGIGAATVTRLMKDGYVVYAAARRVDRMEDLQAAGARLVALDLTDDASIVAAIEKIRSETGRLDVLVNNAGYGSYGALEDVPLGRGAAAIRGQSFRRGAPLSARFAMMRAQKSGKIVNVSSVGGKSGEPFGTWYHATKYALEGLSDCLRY